MEVTAAATPHPSRALARQVRSPRGGETPEGFVVDVNGTVTARDQLPADTDTLIGHQTRRPSRGCGSGRPRSPTGSTRGGRPGDLPALAQVLGAGLGLLVERRDVEVPRPIRSQRARQKRHHAFFGFRFLVWQRFFLLFFCAADSAATRFFLSAVFFFGDFLHAFFAWTPFERTVTWPST